MIYIECLLLCMRKLSPTSCLSLSELSIDSFGPRPMPISCPAPSQVPSNVPEAMMQAFEFTDDNMQASGWKRMETNGNKAKTVDFYQLLVVQAISKGGSIPSPWLVV